MIRSLVLTISVLPALFRSRADLMLENLALRQQLATFISNGRRRVWLPPTASSGSPCGGDAFGPSMID